MKAIFARRVIATRALRKVAQGTRVCKEMGEVGCISSSRYSPGLQTDDLNDKLIGESSEKRRGSEP